VAGGMLEPPPAQTAGKPSQPHPRSLLATAGLPVDLAERDFSLSPRSSPPLASVECHPKPSRFTAWEDVACDAEWRPYGTLALSDPVSGRLVV